MQEMSSGLSRYHSKHQVGGRWSPLCPHSSSLSSTDTTVKTHTTNVTRSGTRPKDVGSAGVPAGCCWHQGSTLLEVPPAWIYVHGQMVMLVLKYYSEQRWTAVLPQAIPPGILAGSTVTATTLAASSRQQLATVSSLDTYQNKSKSEFK